MPPSEILVFGEDINDCTALQHLIRALLPRGISPTVRAMRRPIVLSKNAANQKRAKMADEIARFANGFEKAGRSVTVVAHRDCDAVEPAHIQQAKQLKDDLTSAGVRSVVAATPAWEIESWWMLFPKALQDTRASWRPIDYGSSNVGKIAHAKERLSRDLRPENRPGCKDFHESDGAKIAEMLAKDRSQIASRKAQSASFEAFRKDLDEALAEK